MITKEQAKPGTDVIFDGIRQTTILTGSYEDAETGLMIKTSLYPGGQPADKFELAIPQNGVAIKEQPIVVFKGKMVGDTEETIITPQLIEERSKPLLELKIKGILDNEGAEKVKEAILKAVKMRTLVEKQADPLIKAINAQAKKDVQSVRDLAQPIYDACLKTQNTLQLTYDAWQTEVNKAKQAEEEKYREKTEGREAKLYSLGFVWNGKSFVGYGKFIDRDFLFGLDDRQYEVLITELEGLQMQAGISGVKQQQPEMARFEDPTARVGADPATKTPWKPFDNIIYERYIPEVDIYIFITNGPVGAASDALVANDEVLESGYFVQVITR